jgi:hypothetical protein
VRALPSLQSLYDANKDKGLHIFHVDCQNATRERMTEFLRERNNTVPTPISGSDFSAYRDGSPGGLPYAFVIGVDGTVVWEGRSGYNAPIQEELAKIKYPGLGKLEVARGLERAATAFSTGELGRAQQEAERMKERNEDNEELVADAEFIIKRVEERAEAMKTSIQEAKAARRYHEAIATLEEIQKAFRGTDMANEARDEVRDMGRDREIQRELRAWNDLERVIQQNERARDNATRRQALNRFYERNEGTAAAEEARKLSESLS